MTSSDESEERYTEQPTSPDAKTCEQPELEEPTAFPSTYSKVRPWLWGILIVVAWVGLLLTVLIGNPLLLLLFISAVPLGLLADYVARLYGRMAENRTVGSIKRIIPLFLLPPFLHVVVLSILRLVFFCVGFFAAEWFDFLDVLPEEEGKALQVRFVYGSILAVAVSALARLIPVRCANCEQKAWLGSDWVVSVTYRCKTCGYDREYEIRPSDPMG